MHVGRGANSATDLYWGLGETIFENATNDKKKAGDGAYLFDPKGNLRCVRDVPVPRWELHRPARGEGRT